MPAPAVYVLAVVSAVGAAVAFKHFVYDPHLAPVFEQWAEEYLAHRRAQRQRQGPIAVPATIPLRRRRGDRSDSNTTVSEDDDDDLRRNAQFGHTSRENGNSASSATKIGSDVNQWRSDVERSARASSLRHRATRGVHPTDSFINPDPNPTMSPTHVIFDSSTSAPTTPTATLQSSMPSPPPVVSSIGTPQSFFSESTIRTQVLANDPSPPVPEDQTPRITSPTIPEHHSPPPFSSPIPSLSQSYPQELDRERGVELLSPPSSGTSSPFTTFSPLVAPQALSPFAVVQPLDPDQDQDPSSEFDRWTFSHPPSRVISSSQITNSSSHYQSFPTSPIPPRSDLSSPLDVIPESHIRSPLEEQLSLLSSPSPINFASPNALSPRSPHSNLSDLESMTDLDVMSDPGSDGSGGSWAEVSSAS